jgi:hypothetical protein
LTGREFNTETRRHGDPTGNEPQMNADEHR